MSDIKIDRGFNYLSTVTIVDDNNLPIVLSGYNIFLDIYTTAGEIQTTFSTISGGISVINNVVSINIPPQSTLDINSGYYTLYADNGSEKILLSRGQLSVFPESKSNLEYLIPYLRLKIGDTTQPYRYLDEWLKIALSAAIKALMRYWKSKYFVDDNFFVYRNTQVPEMFDNSAEPSYVIEPRDEPIIITMAAIIVLEGSLENSSWNTGSWRDAEIAYSNIEQGKIKKDILLKLKEELDSYLLPPTKRLGNPIGGKLVGYINYPAEYGDSIKTQ